MAKTKPSSDDKVGLVVRLTGGTRSVYRQGGGVMEVPLPDRKFGPFVRVHMEGLKMIGTLKTGEERLIAEEDSLNNGIWVLRHHNHKEEQYYTVVEFTVMTEA